MNYRKHVVKDNLHLNFTESPKKMELIVRPWNKTRLLLTEKGLQYQIDLKVSKQFKKQFKNAVQECNSRRLHLVSL